jgi:DNA adenine methylase
VLCKRNRTVVAKQVQAIESVSVPPGLAYLPILRWAGSKRRLLSQLVATVPDRFETYYEPFAGSACLFFALLPKRAVLGDVNKHVIGSYRTLRRSPADIWERLSAMSKSKKQYYDLRSQKPTELSAVDRAARFIYLNSFCFNGVYRENQRGQFNVPRGTKFRGLPELEHLAATAEAFAGVAFRASDFEECVADAKAGDFVYMDPPYAATKRNRGEYGAGAFGPEDMKRFVSTCKRLASKNVNVLVSYAYSRALADDFGGWTIKRVRVKRSVSGFAEHRGGVYELLARNY